MRLISCYILGFGKFKEQSFDLSKDVVEIKADNGWGKTTLAAFIECMLFGMDNSRSKSLDENTRLKYEPFGGGAYGGTLSFSYRGNVYRVERSFGKTQGADTVKLYDKNNLPSYDFGEQIDRLGELLLRVNKASYHKSAYVPQGEIVGEGLPEDTKARLLALLSVGENKEHGAQTAIDRLEKAESALRGKRAPKRGKLDLLEARLYELENEKRTARSAAEVARNIRAGLDDLTARLKTTENRLQGLQVERDENAKRAERAAALSEHRELQNYLAQTQEALNKTKEFFRVVDPLTVNLSGLQTAVNEYYSILEWLSTNADALEAFSQKHKQKQELEEKIAVCKQTLESFEMMLKTQTEGAGTSRKGKKAKKKRQKSGGIVGVLLMLAVMIFGASQIALLPALGWPITAIGGVGLVFSAVSLLFTSALKKENKEKTSFEDEELNARYKAAQKEYEEARFALADYPQEAEIKARELAVQTEQKRNRASGLKTAIESFLSNFAFKELYDYRASLELLRTKIDEYTGYYKANAEYERRRESLPKIDGDKEILEKTFETASTQELTADIMALEKERQTLMSACADENARLGVLEERAAALSDYCAEESRLFEEKARLERKLSAIKAARMFIERARENMASRYLDSVERASAQYLQALGGIEAQSLRFSADGLPQIDDRGALRPLDYYSVGTKELVGFCTRIALVEAMYQNARPVLILDDPLVNFDDKTTALCKRFIKELSKKYQIIYCTCKEERRLSK